jgi:hypothetical protein
MEKDSSQKTAGKRQFEIKRDTYGIWLSTTTNGHHWTGMPSMTTEDLKDLISAIDEFLINDAIDQSI